MDTMPAPCGDVFLDPIVAARHAPEVSLDPGWKHAPAFTVSAWVDCAEPRAEAMQVLVAAWDFAQRPSGFQSYDAGCTGGLETTGYFGAIFDGRYVYFAPQGNGGGRHGRALRYDTCGGFGQPSSWQAYDAGGTGGLVTRGYYGAVFDGRFVYYVPRLDGRTHHSRLLRLDTRGDFVDSERWQACDAGVPVSYQGAAFDGRYVYCAPGYHQDRGPSGLVLRLDTQAPFRAAEACRFFDAAAGVGPQCVCFDGALFDGRHVYFTPLERGVVLRYSTGGDFESPASWESYPFPACHGLQGGMSVGCVFDGRFVYFAPYAHSTVMRYDTSGPFAVPESWEAHDVAGTGGLRCRGYDGAAFDGRYVYLIPFWDGADVRAGFHGHLVRHDTRLDFDAAAAWDAADGCALAPGSPGGFNGGAFDGRFLYLAPWRRNADTAQIHAHGRVLRYDTTGPQARFVLKYSGCGHNGGLGGAVPGPSFTVNTRVGARTVQANAALAAGRHLLVGSWDGQRLRLGVDGQVRGEVDCPGAALGSGAPLTIGGFAGGTARFAGALLRVQVATGAPAGAPRLPDAGVTEGLDR
jgi:hypothetical protein